MKKLINSVDTVLADPTEWTVDPWSGELRDGHVWGRGALDMHGPLALMTLTILATNPNPDLYGASRMMLESIRGFREAGWQVTVSIPTRGPTTIATFGTLMPRSSIQITSPQRSIPVCAVVIASACVNVPGPVVVGLAGARRSAITSFPSKGWMPRMSTACGMPALLVTTLNR